MMEINDFENVAIKYISTGVGISTGYLLGKTIYYLLDQGLANTLTVETLQHGTNLINYIQIRAFGGNPEYAGKISGATVGKLYEVRGYFYAVKDSEFSHLDNVRHLAKEVKPKWFDDQLLYYEKHKLEELKMTMTRRMKIPYEFSYLSAYNFVSHYLKIQSNSIANIAGKLNCVFTPLVKFRYAKIDKAIFEEDDMYVGYAYKTKKVMEAWRVGVIGSLLTGINFEWPSRIYANPKKFITGVIQLTAGVALLHFSLTCVRIPSFKPLIMASILLS